VTIPQMILTGAVTPGFVLQSSAMQDGGTIPNEFTCAVTGSIGSGDSPPLSWSGAPAAARAFALFEQDMDVPPPNGPVVHWIIYNISGSLTSLDRGLATTDTLPNGAMQGINSRRAVGYLGSCPGAGTPAHHYVFQLFALDAPLTVKSQPTIIDLQPAMQGHILAQTQLRASFGR
jgi:Raf kinase inhibitor-like YbhB/YbcL family protein